MFFVTLFLQIVNQFLPNQFICRLWVERIPESKHTLCVAKKISILHLIRHIDDKLLIGRLMLRLDADGYTFP